MTDIKDKRNQDYLLAFGYTPPDMTKLKLGHEDYDIELKNIQEFMRYQSKRDIKSFVVNYAKTFDVNLKSLNIRQLQDYAINSYILLNGGELSEDKVKQLNERLTSFATLVMKSKVVEISDIRTGKLIAELEGLLDDAMTGVKLQNPIELIKKIADKKTDMDKIYNHFAIQLKEIKDPSLEEGFSRLTMQEKNKIVAVLTVILRDLNSVKTNKVSVTRKPRKPRKKDPAKMVKNLKYLKEYKDLALVSFNPINIVDAQIIWVFNTKTRKLGVYNAKINEKLSIKGSTILNFDEDTSSQKKLRKPKEVLDKLKEAGKVEQRRILDTVKAVEGAMNGRINKDTILVKVY